MELDSGLGSITGKDISSAVTCLQSLWFASGMRCATPIRRQAGRKADGLGEPGVLVVTGAAAEPLETTLPWSQWEVSSPSC